MAHFIFITQGVKPCVDAMMNDLQAQFFPWPMKKKKTGKEIPNQVVQGALRPIQLWMYIFPEQSTDEVLNTMGIKPGNTGYKEFSGKAAVLRKMMKAQKIPKPDPKVPGRIIRTAGVGIIPIGIRKDKYGSIDGKTEHELL